MFSLFVAAVCFLTALTVLGAYGLVVLARKRLAGPSKPQAPQASPRGLTTARGMQGRQARQLWQAACGRGVPACVIVLAGGTYGVIIAGRVYGGAPQTREAIDRATASRLWA